MNLTLIAVSLAVTFKQHLCAIELIEGAEVAAVNPQEDSSSYPALLSWRLTVSLFPQSAAEHHGTGTRCPKKYSKRANEPINHFAAPIWLFFQLPC